MKNTFWLILVVSGLFSMGAGAGIMTYGHQSGGCGGSYSTGPACTDTWSDSWAGKSYLSAWGTNVWSYTFDITNDGFVAGEDTVLDYNLTFGFRDDSLFDYFEYVKVYQSGVYSSSWEVDTGTRSLAGSFEGTAQLNSTGQLAVNLYTKKGDFYLTDVILKVCGLDAPSKNVTEPSTIALFMLGIWGVWQARKRQV